MKAKLRTGLSLSLSLSLSLHDVSLIFVILLVKGFLFFCFRFVIDCFGVLLDQLRAEFFVLIS